MKVYVFIFLFLSQLSFSQTNINDDLSFSDKSLSKTVSEEIVELEVVEKTLKQVFEREHPFPLFPLYDTLKTNVKFWFLIYNLFEDTHTVYHDKENLNIIYKIVKYKFLKNKDIHIFNRAHLQTQIKKNQAKKIRKALKRLSRGKKGKEEKRILRLLKHVGEKIPRNRKKRRRYYKNLAENLRAQTGQKNIVQKGIERYFVYHYFFEDLVKYFKTPWELFTIPLLESSYNPKAYSKVGAAGIWQFMPRVGRAFMKVNDNIDQRVNPYISSFAALHLFKQSKQILKKWDLAIIAHNSGPKHILKAKRKFRRQKHKFNLGFFLDHYKHPHVGFASKNFYAEFMALNYSIKLREKYFPSLSTIEKSDIKFYIPKCTLYRDLKHAISKKIRKKFWNFNKQIFNKKIIRKGEAVTFDKELPEKFFYKASVKELYKVYPKNWKRIVSKMSCKS